MKSMGEMTQAELGALVQSHLREKSITVVLSGGAAVSIYSKAKYVSLDLDFVNIYAVRMRSIRNAMQEIGFEESARYFKHPDSQYFVEFPPGPLTIGAEPIEEFIEIKLPTGTLQLISQTDCVKDRLAAYYHWGDRQSLEQAILVSRESEINLDEVRRWSEREGYLAEFDRIRDRLSGGRS